MRIYRTAKAGGKLKKGQPVVIKNGIAQEVDSVRLCPFCGIIPRKIGFEAIYHKQKSGCPQSTRYFRLKEWNKRV